jgi:cytochrome c peroxidase
LPDNACVVYFVCSAIYPVAFETVWGAEACDVAWPADVEAQCADEGGLVALSPEGAAQVEELYDQIALSIAAYEGSAEVNAFSSRYDAYLAGAVQLTRTERKGLALFQGKAKCANCHPNKAKMGEAPLFTDFSYDNLGVPRNPDNPVYDSAGDDWVDVGLGGFLESRPDYAGMAEERHAQKVPTLRNVDLRPDPGFVKTYTHNGYFKTLKGIVHFYNTRDVKATCPDRFTSEAEALAQDCWPEPEVSENENENELGDLKLSDEDEDAIVEFLKTLSDGYF